MHQKEMTRVQFMDYVMGMLHGAGAGVRITDDSKPGIRQEVINKVNDLRTEVIKGDKAPG